MRCQDKEKEQQQVWISFDHSSYRRSQKKRYWFCSGVKRCPIPCFCRVEKRETTVSRAITVFINGKYMATNKLVCFQTKHTHVHEHVIAEIYNAHLLLFYGIIRALSNSPCPNSPPPRIRQLRSYNMISSGLCISSLFFYSRDKQTNIYFDISG